MYYIINILCVGAIKMGINELIKSRRIELRLTLREVAEATGVSEATVSRWESGSIGDMRRNRLVALAEVLRLSPAELAGGTPQESISTVFARYGLSDDECTLIEKVIKLDPSKREMALKILAVIAEE